MATPEPRFIFHVLPNAHLDPVWLWDWREGLNEGIVTIRTILDLMDELPKLTFIRGESAIYEHVERTDPKTFDRIHAMVSAGRWDIVGGTYIQPDSNLAATETLCRQFERGLSYFQSRFGRRPTISWQADSFGHTPGWPNILRSFGMTGFAFTRPQQGEFPMAERTFWWKTDYGDRLLCYRQHWGCYCSERSNTIDMLDGTLNGARTQPFINVGFLMGLGNHGGGPSRRNLADVARWAETHPEVEVRYSTLHGLFAAIREEIADSSKSALVPEVSGDLGFCLRGCYSSVSKFKSAFRRAEAALPAAEATQVIIAAKLGDALTPLESAWDSVLFNSFHDILPGTSIERALEEQLSSVGFAQHQAQAAQFAALNRLAGAVDTSVPAPQGFDRPTDVSMLVWNPLPRPVERWFELEASMDYRPLWGRAGNVGSVPLSLVGPDGTTPRFQEVATEHLFSRDVAWRRRVAVYDTLPAYGWKVYRFGYRDDPMPPSFSQGGCAATSDAIAPAINSHDWRVAVMASGDVRVEHHGQSLFGVTGALQVRLLEDIGGSWGGRKEEPASFCHENIRERWHVTQSHVLEAGPDRAALWTRWQGSHSWLELTFYVATGTPFVRIKGRLLMNDRSSRVKLVLPATGHMEMEVPGSRVVRNQVGSLPAGRWGTYGEVGFVSDVLSDVDATADELRITLARASRYADDAETTANAMPWLPAIDSGELKFECLLANSEANLGAMADELLNPPAAILVPPHPGTLPRTGSFGQVTPASIRVLAMQAEGPASIRLRLQNIGTSAAIAAWHDGVRVVPLGTLGSGEIRTSIVGVNTAAR